MHCDNALVESLRHSQWSAVTQWLERCALDQEDWHSNYLASILKLALFCLLHIQRCLSSFSSINEYLAIDSGGCV